MNISKKRLCSKAMVFTVCLLASTLLVAKKKTRNPAYAHPSLEYFSKPNSLLHGKIRLKTSANESRGFYTIKVEQIGRDHCDVSYRLVGESLAVVFNGIHSDKYQVLFKCRQEYKIKNTSFSTRMPNTINASFTIHLPSGTTFFLTDEIVLLTDVIGK